MMKIWESECFSLNFITGEMSKIITDRYFEGVNFEQAQLSLVKSKLPHLRLTGKWFKQPKSLQNNIPLVYNNEPIEELSNVYEELVDPIELVKHLTDDEFLDWLNQGTEKDVRAALSKFQEKKMDKYIGFIIGHLKFKYGS